MKVPKVRHINEWYEVDEYLHTDFMLDIDYHIKSFGELSCRWLDIPLDEIETYVVDNELHITSTDCWDYGSESVYQEYSVMSFEEWLDNYLDDVFVRDYIEYHMKNNGVPTVTVLE